MRNVESASSRTVDTARGLLLLWLLRNLRLGYSRLLLLLLLLLIHGRRSVRTASKWFARWVRRIR